MYLLYAGYALLITIMYIFFEKMNSMNKYEVQETSDAYLSCNRVEDIENDVKVIQTLMETLATQVDKMNDKLHDITNQVDLQTDIHEESIKVMNEKTIKTIHLVLTIMEILNDIDINTTSLKDMRRQLELTLGMVENSLDERKEEIKFIVKQLLKKNQ